MQILIDSAIESARTIEETEQSLMLLLGSGCRIWTEDNGSKVLIETRVRVEQVRNLKIYVYAKEHAPPHFRVVANEIDASFAIADGALLYGKISKKDEELVLWWFQRYREKLVRIWNDTRPTDCPVGPISR